MKEIYSNCTWFSPEPKTIVDLQSPASQDHFRTSSSDQTGGSKPPVYGKCWAHFQDSDNNEQRHDFGTFSSSECAATDDMGRKLFRIE
jgi:hypothetical protein